MLKLSKTPCLIKLLDNYTRRVHTTTCSATFSSNCLSFNFSIQDNAIISFGESYNDPLWKGDIVEIMITLGTDSRYLELEVNPDGIAYAVIINNSDYISNLDVTPIDIIPFAYSAKRNSKGWEAIVHLPLQILIELGWDEHKSKINIYQQDFKSDGTLALYAAYPTLCSTFHVPQKFEKLELEFETE
ncbi:MAG: hypothetical protein LBE09_01205 [Christensenellaceae bacterium]|jgi:hypothetical protein|nr:hypothetical protein [Christensenellaceae bacterium]